jgi:hypothetical protein
MSREEFLNSLLFAINEIRADDIFKIIENNPDFKRVLNEIKEIDVKDFDVIKAVYKIVSLVNNITYIEGFKDGFNFFNDILKEN